MNRFWVKLCLLVVYVEAFSSPQRPSKDTRSVAKNNLHFGEVWKAFGVATIGAALTFNPPPALAEDSILASSTLQLSTVTKTVDMSMPSYGSISATQGADLDSLVVEPVGGGPSQGSSTKSSQNASKKSEGGPGINFGAVLPSMNKQGPAQDGDKNQNVKVVDTSLPSYGEASNIAKDKSPFGV